LPHQVEVDESNRRIVAPELSSRRLHDGPRSTHGSAGHSTHNLDKQRRTARQEKELTMALVNMDTATAGSTAARAKIDMPL